MTSHVCEHLSAAALTILRVEAIRAARRGEAAHWPAAGADSLIGRCRMGKAAPDETGSVERCITAMRNRKVLNLALTGVLIASCAGAAAAPPAAPPPIDVPPSRPARVTMTPVVVDAAGRITPVPERRTEDLPLDIDEGEATYYASKFDGRKAASGIVFRNSEPYAAHRTYPFGTVVRVTNLANDRSVVVRVIDRGPHGTSARAKRTIIDLSQSAARDLDFMRQGRTPVLVEVLEWGTGRR